METEIDYFQVIPNRGASLESMSDCRLFWNLKHELHVLVFGIIKFNHQIIVIDTQRNRFEISIKRFGKCSQLYDGIWLQNRLNFNISPKVEDLLQIVNLYNIEYRYLMDLYDIVIIRMNLKLKFQYFRNSKCFDHLQPIKPKFEARIECSRFDQ